MKQFALPVLACLLLGSFVFYVAWKYDQGHEEKFGIDDYSKVDDRYAPIAPFLSDLFDYKLLIALVIAGIAFMVFFTHKSWFALAVYVGGGFFSIYHLAQGNNLAQGLFTIELLFFITQLNNPKRWLLLPIAFFTHKFGFLLLLFAYAASLDWKNLVPLAWINTPFEVAFATAQRFAELFFAFPIFPLVIYSLQNTEEKMRIVFLALLFATLFSFLLTTRGWETLIPLMAVIIGKDAEAWVQKKKYALLVALAINFLVMFNIYLAKTSLP